MTIKKPSKVTTKKACVSKVRSCKGADAGKSVKKAVKKVVAKSVTFTVHADSGKQVYLAGCFNNWNPVEKKMAEKKSSGIYSATIKLAPGSYQYKYVIDGTWCSDPENADFVQNEHGTLNSVVVVK